MRPLKEAETNVFDLFSRQYDAWYDSEEGRPLYESELLCLRPMVEHAAAPILEIGVGTGRFAMHFPDVVGVDPSANALRFAATRGVKTIQAHGENLPLEDGAFGCVLMIATLCFVKNPHDVLKEAKRVAKEKGSIIMGVVPKDSPWGVCYEKKKREGHPFYARARFYSLADTRKFLGKAGMRITRIRSTLLQKPDEARRIEEPVEGYCETAGFLCIEAKKCNL